jgi:lysophosphatidylcholine acyltransferase/lyso-PAF acetyltransferase
MEEATATGRGGAKCGGAASGVVGGAAGRTAAGTGVGEDEDEDANPFEFLTPPSSYELSKLVFFIVSGLALLRVVLFLAVLGVIYALSTVATLGLDPKRRCLTPFAPWRRAVMYPVQPLCRLALLIFGFWRIKVNGKLDPEACLIVANHHSVFDAVVLYWLCGPAFVAKAEVFKWPAIGKVLAGIQGIPVVRESSEGREFTKEAMQRYVNSQQEADAAKRFPKIAIFPQGSTSNIKMLTMWQRGAFLFGLPVQAVALDYSANVNMSLAYVVTRPKDYFARRHLSQLVMHLEVTFLPLHRPSEAERADVTLFANNVRASVARVLGAQTTEHYFEDAKLYAKAVQMKSEVHELQLLERPKKSDKVSLHNFQLKELKDLFGEGSRSSHGLKDAEEALVMFSKLDKDGDGAISFGEFCQALGLSEEGEHARLLFDLMDLDKSGSISFRELVLGMALCSPDASVTTEEKARFAFDLYDANKDGMISEQELRDLLLFSKAGSNRQDDELKRLVTAFVDKSRGRKGSRESESGDALISWPLFLELVQEDKNIVQSVVSKFAIGSLKVAHDPKSATAPAKQLKSPQAAQGQAKKTQ